MTEIVASSGPNRKLLFVTGTRADFGKQRDIMLAVQRNPRMSALIVATGMHLIRRYGHTVNEIEKAGLEGLHKIPNQIEGQPMALTLATTLETLTRVVHEEKPDAILVHGDRVEALAAALAGSLANIRVIHIEGGEVSGTIDDAIRHSISKHAHIHLVTNEQAKRRLRQLGEGEERIFVVGSPEVDVLTSPNLPGLDTVLQHYDIPFSRYGILVLHPVTTELEQNESNAAAVVDALLADGGNWVIIDPNNDEGCLQIRHQLSRLEGPRFYRLPSMRFERFITLMRNAELMLGNSSAGVREAPVLGLPSVNVGTRQRRRSAAASIINTEAEFDLVLKAIHQGRTAQRRPGERIFGEIGAQARIISLLEGEELWAPSLYKDFVDL